jgi:PTS system nitrogen regulatory IIA component
MELTLSDVAARLKVPLDTIHRWIRQGKIPVHSSRGEYVIRLSVFERWAAEHQLPIHSPNQSEACNRAAAQNLAGAMQQGGVFLQISGKNKETVLQQSVDLLPNIQPAERNLIYEKLVEREQLASTGIGHGIALPHPRAPLTLGLACPQITTCYLEKPIAYGAIDHQPVGVLMILLSTSTKEHLDLLSRIAFCLRDADFRDRLHQHPGPDELFDLIAQMEVRNAQ